MAQTARTETDKATNAAKDATDNVAELGRRAVGQTVDTAREMTDRAEGTARRGVEALQQAAHATLEIERTVARRSAESVAEVSQALVQLVHEQTRINTEAFQALTRTVDWDQVARIQSNLLRASVERTVAFTRRYAEVLEAVVATAATATRDQARKAA